jgi:hypothetical protein
VKIVQEEWDIRGNCSYEYAPRGELMAAAERQSGWRNAVVILCIVYYDLGCILHFNITVQVNLTRPLRCKSRSPRMTGY